MSAQRRIGPYQLTGELGRGGMGAVYRARHRRLGYEVALKVLLAQVGRDDNRRRRFRREVETLRRFEHPNVVEVLDAGEEAGRPWLALRYVPCETLQERLEREGPLPPDEVARLVEEIGGALIAAHEAGILHRDLKPDNVLCKRDDGRFLLTDFGLARDEELAESRRLSVTGAIQGTPGYWAPEQAGGRPTGVWTDVYGFSALLYAACAGAPPIAGDSFVEVVMATERRAPEPIARDDLPAPLVRAIRRGLSKQPDERFASIEELLEAGLRPPEPTRTRAALAVALLALLVVGVGLATTREVDDGSASATPATPASEVPSPAPPGLKATLTQEELDALSERVEQLYQAKQFEALEPLLVQLADAGRASAAFNLGRFYQDGLGGAQDAGRSLRYYRLAAKLGSPMALSQLGLHYLRGTLGLAQSDVEARRWFRRAAKAGSPSGMLNLGNVLMSGRGGPADPAEAKRWFERSARLNNPPAMVRLGEHLAYSQKPPDAQGAARWFRSAAIAGDAVGAFRLSQVYEKGWGVPQSEERSVRWLRVAAEKGHRDALVRLADRLAASEGVAQDEARAAALYRRAADAGEARAAYSLAVLYRRGGGVTKDLAQYRAWLRRAAEGGVPGAMHDLAVRLWRAADGFPRSPAEAKRWLDRAREVFGERAARGSAPAMVGLGQLLQRGLDRKADLVGAVRWFRKAAEAGNVHGMQLLAECYFEGKGVARDLGQAARWIGRAAREGLRPAIVRYAFCFLQGLGVKRDLGQAERWAREATRRNVIDGAFLLGLILPQKSPPELSDARTWLERAAARGHFDATVALVDMLSGPRGWPPDPRAARRWLARARAHPDLPKKSAAQRTLAQAEARLAELGR